MIIDIENKKIEFILDGEWIKIDNFDKIAQQVNEQIQDWEFKLALRYWTVLTKKKNIFPKSIIPYKFLFDTDILIIYMDLLTDFNIQGFLKIILDIVEETKNKMLEKIGIQLAKGEDCFQDYNIILNRQLHSDIRRKRFNDALINSNPNLLNLEIEVNYDDENDAKLEFEDKQLFDTFADIWNPI